MLALKKIVSWFEEFKENKKTKSHLKKYGSICYCPDCKNPLLDTPVQEGDGFRYTCSRCSFKPLFLYHIAPCPIYIEEEEFGEDGAYDFLDSLCSMKGQ